MNPNLIPDTAAYLYLGLGAVATITGLFIASLLIRVSRLRRELEIIEETERDS